LSWPIAISTSQHVVALDGDELARRLELRPALRVDARLDHLFEHDAGELAVLDHERLRVVIVEDRYALVHRVLELPVGGLHDLPRRAHGDGDLFRAEAERAAAAVHRRVPAADHDDAAAHALDVAEGDRGQPVDADVDVLFRLLAAGNFEVLAARRAGADEHRVVAFRQDRLEALHLAAEAFLNAHVDDAVDLLVEHLLRQAERGDVGPHETAAFGVLLEQRDVIAERQQVARHRE
jgi:hypothetical protein